MLLWRRNPVLFKIETEYGTDAEPTGGANAILAFNGQFDPNPQNVLERRPMRPFLGMDRQPVAGRHVTFQFETELAASGGAGTAPAYGPILRACGLAEDITAETDVQYDPVSEDYEAASIYWNMDGALHKMLGARGELAIVVRGGEVPMLRFSMTGLHVDPSAVALPTADFSAFEHPRPATPANTPTFSLDGFTAGSLRELTLNLGNAVRFRQFANSESVDIVDRVATGQAVIEAPALGTKNFFTISKGQADGSTALSALQLIHGAGAGNIVQVDAGQVQILNPRYAENDGVAELQMDLSLTPDDGDDELKITVK